jgi:hypothetical protein
MPAHSLGAADDCTVHVESDVSHMPMSSIGSAKRYVQPEDQQNDKEQCDGCERAWENVPPTLPCV